MVQLLMFLDVDLNVVVCIGCPGWDGCCAKVWGSCIGCPTWRSCCTRLTNPICLAANAACQLLRTAAYVALALAKKILEAASSALNVAKAALSAAQAIVDKSRIALDVAIAALEAVKNTVKAGFAAITAIAQQGLGNLISIHKIEFNAAIDVAETGSFSGNIEATLVGVYFKFSFSLNLKSVDQMARDLAEKVFPGIIGLRKRRGVIAATPRHIHPVPPRRRHPRDTVGNEHSIDGVDRTLKLERWRRAIGLEKMKREANKLKAANERIDSTPQQNIHLTLDDIYVGKLKACPGKKACSSSLVA